MLQIYAGKIWLAFMTGLLFFVMSVGVAGADEPESSSSLFAQFGGGGAPGGGGGGFPSGGDGGGTFPPVPGPDITPTLTTPDPGEVLPIEIVEPPETLEPQQPDIVTLPFLEPGQQLDPLIDPFGDLPVAHPPDLHPILPSNPNPPDEDERPPGFAPPNAPFYVVGREVGAEPVAYPAPNPAPPGEAPPAGSPPRGPEEFFNLSSNPDTRRQQLLALATVLITEIEVNGAGIGVCTGSHLGNRKILTAHHCLNNQQTGQQFENFNARFGQVTYEDVGNRDGIPARPQHNMNPDEQQLDFLILVLDEPAPIEFRGSVVRLTSYNPLAPFTAATRLETILIL